MNAGGVWKRNGLLRTVIFQFEYNYPQHRSDLDIRFVIDTCIETVKDYADLHGYDYIFETTKKSTYDDLTCEWIYYLKDLAKEYDNIIVIDTDVYVVDYDKPFPINNKGYVCYSNGHSSRISLNGKELNGTHDQMFANSGIIKLDKKTAINLYDWFITNRDDSYEMLVDDEIHISDQVHILKYLMEHPKDFNPILSKEFHWSPHRNTFDDNPVLCHLCVNHKEKYNLLCTILEKYT